MVEKKILICYNAYKKKQVTEAVMEFNKKTQDMTHAVRRITICFYLTKDFLPKY